MTSVIFKELRIDTVLNMIDGTRPRLQPVLFAKHASGIEER